jgi:hypothetical protein
MHANLVELNAKLDRLLAIFEEATTALHVEEGGLSFKEQVRPIIERMNRILEQNSEIAQGIVAIADIVKELKEDLASKGVIAREELGPPEPIAPMTRMAPGMPPRMPGPVPGMPPPVAGMPGGPLPPPPRRRRFGL